MPATLATSAPAADAAHDFHFNACLGERARERDSRRPRVCRVDFKSAGDEEYESAAALEHDELAAAPTQDVSGDFPDLGGALGRDAFIEPFGLHHDRDVVAG